MPNETLSTYKGRSIITRWSEVRPASNWVALDSGPSVPSREFTASFSVEPRAGDSGWQQFPEAVFDTGPLAAANALTAAERSIDLTFEAR